MGFRLGEFVGGMGFRETTTRMVVEAGTIDTKGPTARQQFAVEDGRRLNEDIPANHTFVSDEVGVNTCGRPWVQTPWDR